MESLAWICALSGLLLGGAGCLVPGFPGCAVALLGLVGFAGLTDFTIVTPPALLLASGIVLAGAVGQVTGPVAAGRAAGGTAGAATGAAIGAALGSLLPLPGLAWVLAVVLASTLGLVASRRQVLGWVRGVVGTAGGCAVAIVADALAVLGVGAVLGVADFVHALGVV